MKELNEGITECQCCMQSGFVVGGIVKEASISINVIRQSLPFDVYINVTHT